MVCLVGLPAARVRSAARPKQTRPRAKRDVSAGVRTALPQETSSIPVLCCCSFSYSRLPQESATSRQRRRTQCRTWPLGPSQVLDSLSLSQPTTVAAKPVGEPGWCCIWHQQPACQHRTRQLGCSNQCASPTRPVLCLINPPIPHLTVTPRVPPSCWPPRARLMPAAGGGQGDPFLSQEG